MNTSADYGDRVNLIPVDSPLLNLNKRWVVLGGAGLSAASGIPTYRDAQGNWLYNTPIQHGDFIQHTHVQRRYWARSYYGWPAVAAAQPSAAHHALASLEEKGCIELIISQNVDRLHQRAGSKSVVDLHGRLDRVYCLACERDQQRDLVQQQITLDNRELPQRDLAFAPDGDADIDERIVSNFVLPECSCGGALMPSVVFFGGAVPRDRVERCLEAVSNADGLLVVGTSAQVFSGFRFCRKAAQLGKPVIVINPGQTRADPLASLRYGDDCQRLLPEWAQRM
jgi:NAD-dependent SIR2 family protein deacetylase